MFRKDKETLIKIEQEHKNLLQEFERMTKEFKQEQENLQHQIERTANAILNANTRTSEMEKRLDYYAKLSVKTETSIDTTMKNIAGMVADVNGQNRKLTLDIAGVIMDLQDIKKEIEVKAKDVKEANLLVATIMAKTLGKPITVVDDRPSKPRKKQEEKSETITEQPEQEQKEELKEIEVEKPKKTPFRNDIINSLIEENPSFADVGWTPEAIRDLSTAINSYYDTSIASRELYSLVKNILLTHKKPSTVRQFITYFKKSGMLKKIQGTWRYQIIRDIAIPQQKKKLGLLEELGYGN